MGEFLTSPIVVIGIVTIALTVVIAAVGALYKFAKWQGGVDSDRTTFKDFIKEVRADVKEILDRLPVRAVAGSSPLRLTDLGKRISKKIDAKDLASKIARGLSSEVEGKSPYGIQEFCRDYVKKEKGNLFDDEQANLLEMCAYEEGVGLDQVYEVIAIELRDELLTRGKSNDQRSARQSC